MTGLTIAPHILAEFARLVPWVVWAWVVGVVVWGVRHA